MGYGNDGVSVVGTVMKFVLSLDLPGSLTMDDVGFEAVFYIYGNKTVVIPKSGMVRQDSGAYLLVLDTSRLGSDGRIKCQISVDVPDANCEDGVRKEVVRIDTDEIVRNGVR